MNRELPCRAIKPSNATCAAIVALTVAAGLSGRAAGQESVVEGQRIWSGKAQCAQCHGWAGDGSGGLHSSGQAASLRSTKLTRDQIRTTIQCGRPGTAMPHFDRFAYTDKRCYDMTAQDLGDQVPERSAVTLQVYEIDALADYVATKIKDAGPITRDQCIEFFKSGAGSRCEGYAAK
jgi:mono/diheme cytochrome c family protein